MSVSIWFWVAFHLGVFIALFVDLFSDRAHERISLPSAIRRSFLWVGLSLVFNALCLVVEGPDQAVDFLTGYLIEYSLSVDNIFVFGLIFAYFKVPPRYEHRVLIWGILGALAMRATMIGLGVALVSRFHFVLFVFGAFLVITGLRMLLGKSQPLDLEHNFILRLVRRMLPVTNDYHGPKFIASCRRPAHAHAARARPHRDRSDGPGFCRRLHPRGARDHARHFHCLYLEHLRHPRLALALLPARQSRSAFHLFAHWAGDYSLFRRPKDAGRTLDQDTELAFAAHHHRSAGHDHHCLTPRDQKQRRRPGQNKQALQSRQQLGLLTPLFMKLLLVTLLGAGFAATSLADIQDPPAADYGPTRKLGRGLSNMLYGWAEIPVTIGKINTNEGNAAAASYGVVRGTGRAFALRGGLLRGAALADPGLQEEPIFPSCAATFRGFTAATAKFPPELGNESKYPYVRDY